MRQKYEVQRECLLFAAVLVIGIALRVVMLLHQSVVSPDSPGYMYSAAAIGTDGLKSLFVDGFGGSFSIYPLFIYLVHIVIGDLILSGQLVSLFFGSLLLVPAYLIAREMMGARVGLVTAFLVAVHPHLIRYSGEVLKDSTLTFFSVGSAALALFGCTKRNRLLILLAGASAWTTAVVRLHGIIIIPSLIVALFLIGLYQKDTIRETLIRLVVLLLPMPIVGYIAFSIFFGTGHPHFVEGLVEAARSVATTLHKTQMYPDILMANNPQVNPSYLEVITGYPSVAAAAHFFMVFTTAFFVPFFILLLVGLYRDRHNLLRRGPRLFILSFSLTYILFDLVVVMIFFFISKRHLMPLAVVLLPWSAWAIYEITAWFRSFALTRSGIKRRFLLSVIPLFVVVWVVFAFNLARTTTWENLRLEYKKSAGEYIKKVGGERFSILAPASDPLVTFYSGGEGAYFLDPKQAETMFDETRPDFILWDTDTGPLPEEFRLLAERGRIEPIKTISGVKGSLVYIYRNAEK